MSSTQSSNNPESLALSPKSSNAPRSLLVTGGAGFIGANFVHYWLREHPADRVVVLDLLTYAGNRQNLAPVEDQKNFRFVHGDIRDYGLVVGLLRGEVIDTIVHFAAESHVDRSIHGPDEFVDTNVVGTHTLLKAAKKIWLGEAQETGKKGEGRREKEQPKQNPAQSPSSSESSSLSTQSSRPCRFHHVSTDEVYGSLGPADPPFAETNQYLPNSPYAASKAGSDHLVRSYHETYGLPVTTSNCSNNYGPYQFPEKLIPLVITNILAGKPLPIYGDGLQIRDWLYVEDHNQAIDLILEQGRVGETYNIGGNNEWTNIEIVRLICRLLDQEISVSAELARRFPAAPAVSGRRSESLISHVRDRPGHDRRYAINAGKIGRELGYAPRESFESGIRKTIAWYLENESWWRQVMDGSYRRWLERNYGGTDG